jgi:integrase
LSEKTIATYGLRGRTVRVYLVTLASGLRIIRAVWRERGKKVYERWSYTRANVQVARAYAEGVAERLQKQIAGAPERLTVVELIEKYLAAHDGTWRDATMQGTKYRLGKFLLFAGRGLYADQMTPELVDEYRKALRAVALTKTRKPMASNQIALCVSVLKGLYAWARMRRLIGENPIAEYVMRLHKDDTRAETHEYTNDEWAAVARALNPKDWEQWRAYCLIVLGGVLGARQNALRHLTWADVDLVERSVVWQKRWDKTGRERKQSLPRDAVRCFRIARVWRRTDEYTGVWVFYAVKKSKRHTAPYTYSALNGALHRAEERAGVTSIPYRAMHGLRRTSMGNALKLSGDVKEAAEWIGDTSLQVASKYLKRRDAAQKELAKLVTLPEGET